MDDLISRQSALDALDKHFESFIKRFGYDSYERADEKTKLVCDGLSEAEDVIMGLPSATDTNVGTKLGTNLAEVGTDLISRQAAIDELVKMLSDCFYADEEVLDAVETTLKGLPSVQPERTCVNCGRTANNGGWYADGRTRCPIEEHYALPKDGYCHLWEKRNVTDDDYPESNARNADRFELIQSTSWCDVVVDTETGVEYAVSTGAYNWGNMTVLVDETGRPLKWKGE